MIGCAENTNKYPKGDILYLSAKIDQRLAQFESELVGSQKPAQIAAWVKTCVQPWGVRVFTEYGDIEPGTISVGGLYDTDRVRQNIELFLYFADAKRINWTDETRDNFKFLVSQVLQHELIHRMQDASRPEDVRKLIEYFPLASNKPELQAEVDYLAELDEIEAYAHDIALEIRYYYPGLNPLDVLRNCSRRHYLPSYRMYKAAFKHVTDWKVVHDKLLKKVFLWLPHTEEQI